jgi:hypothetical protein
MLCLFPSRFPVATTELRRRREINSVQANREFQFPRSVIPRSECYRDGPCLHMSLLFSEIHR